MKVLLLLSCLMLSVYGTRVKRIVGGEQAAIPQPIPSLQKVNTGSRSSTGVKAAGAPKDKAPGSVSSAGSSTSKAPTTTSSYVYEADGSVYIYEEDRDSRIFGAKEKDGYISFKGIRYAEPPIKNNRYQRPIFKSLTGQIEAFDYGSPCVQLLPDNSGVVGNEDCLFLNVYTPSVYAKNASGLPVLFWIHGGGFVRGSGNQYGVRDLVKKEVVVVTMNYRLGTLGFLGSDDQQMAGNAGLFDVRAAFEWTKRYITYFGGDPRRIFTAGQGSGASLAMLLAQSDFTSGYIKGVLAMSGTGISSSAVDYAPGNTSKFISQSAHCSGLNALKTIRCLQACDISSLATVQKTLEEDRIGDDGFVSAVSKLLSAGPMVEGENDGRFLSYFLQSSPLDALKNRKMAKVPLLTGTTKTETGNAVIGKFKSDVEQRLKVPEFLEKILPSELLTFNVGLFSNGVVNKLMDTLFKNDQYLGLISSTFSKGLNNFQKVIESTTDAVFNLPATTTSTLWDSVGGESYFYSFEHITNQQVTKSFLEGLPLHSITNSSSEKSASHGDDLLYLFEMQTLDGIPVADAVLTNQKDLKVKGTFVNVVKEFMYKGKPSIPNIKDEWTPFQKDNTYAIISENPKIEKKFRFCQIALWGGVLDKLTDPFCNFPDISNILKSLPQELLKGGLFGTPMKALEKLVPTGNLLPTGTGDSKLGNITSSVTNIKSGAGSPVRIPLLGGTSMKTTIAQMTKPASSTTAMPTTRVQIKVPSGFGLG